MIRLPSGSLPELPTRVLEEYTRIVKECSESASQHRIFQELREAVFIHALLYGTDIYPKFRKFVLEVHVTMSLLSRLTPLDDLAPRLDMLSDDCRHHEEQGRRLEAQHLFAKVQISMLTGDIVDGAVTLTRDFERQVEYNEGSFLTRLFRRNPAVANGGQSEDLQGAIEALKGLQKCCYQLQEVVSCINDMIGKVESGICEVKRLLDRTRRYGDEEILAERFLRWTQKRARELRPVLESYLDRTLHYRVTLALLQKGRTDYLNTHMAIKWRNDMAVSVNM